MCVRHSGLRENGASVGVFLLKFECFCSDMTLKKHSKPRLIKHQIKDVCSNVKNVQKFLPASSCYVNGQETFYVRMIFILLFPQSHFLIIATNRN